MYLHKVESSCGRSVPKPNSDLPEEENYDDAVVPIQDQIENLRIKIALKERYNRVRLEEFEETSAGTASLLKDLFIETRELRYELLLALNSEKHAVQHALRANRQFQLALTDRDTSQAIPWLEDKLYSAINRWNCLLSELHAKRQALEEAEILVVMLEKWPRPGSLPWEILAIARFTRIENTIEDIKVKCETVSILHARYSEIRFILLGEQGKYRPLMAKQENIVQGLRDELKSLQTMLDEAIYFREEAFKNMKLTEHEFYENRRERRKIMAKAQKVMAHALKRNRAKEGKEPKGRRSVGVFDFNDRGDDLNPMSILERHLMKRRALVEQYQAKAARLVEATRVKDLVLLPQRLRIVQELGYHLENEQNVKDEWRNILIKQRDQLTLLLCHFRYTGALRKDKFNKAKEGFLTSIEETSTKDKSIKSRQLAYGKIIVDLRIGVLPVLHGLEEAKRKGSARKKIPERELSAHLRVVLKKLTKLVKTVAALEDLFGNKETKRNYGNYVRAKPTPARLIRVRTEEAENEDEDDADVDMPDSKVPTRDEIKIQSARYIHQAFIKRGLKGM